MAIDKKTIVEHNKDLQKRMIKESWEVTYDRKADTLILGTKFPKGSGSVYINEKEGSMIRVGEDKKIYGFVFENYKSVFLKENEHSFIFWLIFLPDTYRFGQLFVLPIMVYFKIYLSFLKIMKSFKEYRNDLLINDELARIGNVY